MQYGTQYKGCCRCFLLFIACNTPPPRYADTALIAWSSFCLCKLQARQLRRAVAASSSSSSASLGAVAEVQRLLDEAITERDSLAAQLCEVKAAAAAAESARDRAAAEAERATEDKHLLQQQLEELRAGLDDDSATAVAAGARAAGLQVRGCGGQWGPICLLPRLAEQGSCTHCIHNKRV